MGKRYLTCNSLKLNNLLPSEIKNIISKNIFKKRVKIQLWVSLNYTLELVTSDLSFPNLGTSCLMCCESCHREIRTQTWHVCNIILFLFLTKNFVTILYYFLNLLRLVKLYDRRRSGLQDNQIYLEVRNLLR